MPMFKGREKPMVGEEKVVVQRPPAQRTRFEPSRLRTFFDTLVQHLTPPTHPSSTSESALGSSYNHTDIAFSDGEGITNGHGNGNHHLPLELLNSRADAGVYASARSRRRGLTASARRGRGSQANSTSRFGDEEEPTGPADPVSHVVVDNDFEHFTPRPPKSGSDSGSTRTPGAASGTETPGAARRRRAKNGGSEADDNGTGGGEDDDDDDNEGAVMGLSDATSVRRDRRKSWIRRTAAWELIFERIWPSLKHFADSGYPEASKERSFQKEAWFSQKQGCLASSIFLFLYWILTTALTPQPYSIWNYYAYIGIVGIFTLPLPVMVIFDVPRRQPWLWQPFAAGAAWCWGFILTIEMTACQFFGAINNCGTRNFINLMGVTMGLPTLALLVMRQNRIVHLICAAAWLILASIALMQQEDVPKLFYRNLITFAAYHIFLTGTAFFRERSDRQMFALRQQLKLQYRAVQSAQVMERRADQSKKRFVSYIFHEVRVPLNTALLAVQNLDGEGVFKELAEDQSDMVHGLMGSLTMMEKVLNDVLSFNRMESGRFTQARKIFDFHKSIQLVALSHRIQAEMAGVDLELELDSGIDRIGGVFIGDEMRLRQVASNLVSNALKFTEAGSVRIVTKLLYPRLEPTPSMEIDDPIRQAAINSERQRSIEIAENERQISSDPEKGSVALETLRHSRVVVPDVPDFNEKVVYPPKAPSVAPNEGDKEQQPPEKNEHEPRQPHAHINVPDEEEQRNRYKAVIRVEIHDTGVGLKKQDVIDNRLFSPYVQTEIGRRQGGKGSGLGLALVRQIVKLSNGRLGVESEFGKGSMFWFELPYALPPPKARSTMETPRPSVTRAMTGPPTLAVPGMDEAPRAVRLSAGSLADHDGLTRRISANGTPIPRPTITTGESGRPLLASTGSMSTPNQSLESTYEEPLSPPVQVGDLASPWNTQDPFQSPMTEGRRSSEWTAFASSSSSSEAEAAAAAAKASRSKASAEPLPPLSTLVVDDDKLTRMLMSRMLTRLGHKVTTAENGKIALDLIRASFEGHPGAHHFDIMFLDNQMPLLSGVEVAREVREMGCPLYIVGCTGNALREDQDEYLAAGADDLIPKPIHQRAVLDMIVEARRRVAGETQPRDLQEVDD